MAEVRLALAQRAGGFNKLLVLKLLREDLTADEEFLTMFRTEARIAALLNHRNIVQTNEVGVEGGRHFMAMEYLEGQPLSAVLSRVGRRKVPLDLQVYVLAETLHGLAYAHELAGLDGVPLAVVHRDVSPQNVFVTYSGQVKLLDFGIAKIGSAAALTKQGIVKGKAAYMAPEQAAMQIDIDLRADIFAVGVMLWEALTGERFVPRDCPEIAALTRRLSGDDPKLFDVAPNADPILGAVCNKALAFAREDRWADAETFAMELEAWSTKSKNTLEKELGALLIEHFGEERSKIRKVIEHEGSKGSNTDDEDTPPNLVDLPSHPDQQTPSTPRGRDTDGLASVASQPQLTTQTHSRSRPIVFALVAGLVVSSAAFAIFQRTPSGMLQTTDPAPSQGTATTVAIATAPSEVSLRVRVQPPTATFTIDNGPALSTPYAANVARNDVAHSLKFSADGHGAEERTVMFTSNVELDIVLQPTAKSPSVGMPKLRFVPPAVGTGVRSRPSAVSTPEPPAVPPRKTKHSIDEADPYSATNR